MKYIKKVPNTPHAKDIYEVHITHFEVETIDLILKMYGPFLKSEELMVQGGRPLKMALNHLRMGINQIKKSIKENEQ